MMVSALLCLDTDVIIPDFGGFVAIQGFGNAGTVAGLLLKELGALVVAVSDSRGGIVNPNGVLCR